jgi:DNA-binding NarL/FixJ family response regulator
MKVKKAKQIKVGKAVKYKKVKVSPARVIAMYKDGKKVSEIALALGYPKNTGQNRIRRILMVAGVYKMSAATKQRLTEDMKEHKRRKAA